MGRIVRHEFLGSTTALDHQGAPPHSAEIDAQVAQQCLARFRVRTPCVGVSAPVVADLVASPRQAAPTFTRRHVIVQLGFDPAPDLLERESGPPFLEDSRSFCSARYSRLTAVRIRWRLKPT